MSKFMLLSFRTHPQPLPSKAGQAPITPKSGVTRRGAFIKHVIPKKFKTTIWYLLFSDSLSMGNWAYFVIIPCAFSTMFSTNLTVTSTYCNVNTQLSDKDLMSIPGAFPSRQRSGCQRQLSVNQQIYLGQR